MLCMGLQQRACQIQQLQGGIFRPQGLQSNKPFPKQLLEDNLHLNKNVNQW